MPNKIEILFQAKCCPDCGDVRRALAHTGDLEKLAGAMSPERRVEEMERLITADPTRPQLYAWATNIYRDFCLGCGRQYVVEINREKRMVTQQLPPPRIPPTSFKRG